MMDDRLISIGLWLVGVGSILVRWRRLRGTTLVAPAVWAIVALTVIATLAVVAPVSTLFLPQDRVLRWHWYVAATATFCPPMALFGAKRPQNQMWQFIVISLWFVLLMPALSQEIARGGGTTLGLDPVRSWFLNILVLMVALNYLPTRFAVSSLLFTAAQVCLLMDFLPLTVPLALCVGAILLVALKRAPLRTVPPLDRLWLDFRDAFGAVWALRIQQRVNQSAEMYDWKLRLDWRGFTPLEGNKIPPSTEKAVRDNLNNLLRRFVSPQWIAERLGQAVD